MTKAAGLSAKEDIYCINKIAGNYWLAIDLAGVVYRVTSEGESTILDVPVGSGCYSSVLLEW
jgi:hypothetical protein